MAPSFNPGTADGLKALNDYLLTRSYISGCAVCPSACISSSYNTSDDAVIQFVVSSAKYTLLAAHSSPLPCFLPAGTRPPAMTSRCTSPSRAPRPPPTRTSFAGTTTSPLSSAAGAHQEAPSRRFRVLSHRIYRFIQIVACRRSLRQSTSRPLTPRPRRRSFPGKAEGVTVAGATSAPAAAAAPAKPAAAAPPAKKAPVGSDSVRIPFLLPPHISFCPRRFAYPPRKPA